MKLFKSLTACSVFAAVVGCAMPAQAITVIETISAWNGSDVVSFFGETNTATYGQTFIAPSDNFIDSFTFIIDGNDNPDVVEFAGYIAEWDGSKATNLLFTSSPLSTTPNSGFEMFEVSTGGVELVAGSEYVAFFSASNFFDGQIGTSRWAQVETNAYPDGDFVFQNNGSNFNNLFTSNWDQGFLGNDDLAFEFQFSDSGAEPIPFEAEGTMGLVALGSYLYYRKKRSAKA